MKSYIPQIISAVTGLALIGGGIYLITTGQHEHGAYLLIGGAGTLGLPAALPTRKKEDPQ